MRGRSLLKLAAVLILLLLALLVLAVVFRKPLAETAILRYLAERGLPAALEVRELGLESAELRGVRLGEVSLDRLTLSWRAWPVTKARIQGVTATGLRLPLDLTAPEPPLGDLRSLLPAGGKSEGEGGSAGGSAGESGGALPRIEIESAEIALTTAAGPALLALKGRYLPEAERVELTVSGGAPLLSVAGEASADLAGSELRALSAKAEVAAEDRGLAGHFDFSFKRLESDSAAELKLSLKAAEAAFALLSGPAVPQAGALALDVDATAEGLPPAAPLSGEPGAWWGWLSQGRLQGSALLDLDDLDWPQAQGLSGRLAVTARREPESWRLALAEPAGLKLESLSVAALLDRGLPDPLARHLGEGLEITLEPRGEDPLLRLPLAAARGPEMALAVDLHPKAGGRLGLDMAAKAADLAGAGLAEIEVPALRIEAEGLPLPDGSLKHLSLVGSGRLQGEALSAALDARLTASLKAPTVSLGELLLEGPLDLQATAQEVRLSNRDSGLSLKVQDLALAEAGRVSRLEARLSDLALAVGEATTATLTAELPATTLLLGQDGRTRKLEFENFKTVLDAKTTADGVRLDLDVTEGRIALPEEGYVLDRLAGSAAFDAAGLLQAEISQARLVDRRKPALFAPLALSGEAKREETATIAFSAKGRGAGGALQLDLRGTHDPARGRGEAHLKLAPLSFAAEGLQPAALLPSLSALEAVSGRLAGNLRGTWDRKGLRGSGALSFQDLGFSYSGVTVSGLNLELDLDRLLPPGSPPGQRLTAQSVVAGLSLSDVSAEFQLAADAKGQPVLEVSQASSHVLEGRISLGKTRFSAAGGLGAVRLRAEGLDMRKVTDLLQLQELSASGKLSGEIPLSFSKEGLAIDEGHLEATSDGVISFTSEEAKAALASGGEAVALMLQALEDFRYEELKIDLSKPAAGETEIRLSLLGSNPEVLEGHPFRINVNLSTKVEPLLDAYLLGTRLSEKVLRDLWRLRQ